MKTENLAYTICMKNKLIIIIFSSFLILTIVLFSVFNFVLYPKKYSDYVNFYSKEYNIDSALVYAVIKAESDFDKNAKSKSGAIGLMQIIPRTAKWIAEELGENFDENNLFKPETNVRYGCYYLNYLSNKFDNINAVICAYNAGESVVRGWLDDEGKLDESKITYSETKNYLRRVKGFFKVYKNSKICFWVKLILTKSVVNLYNNFIKY